MYINSKLELVVLLYGRQLSIERYLVVNYSFFPLYL